jgi:hypothetical protein
VARDDPGPRSPTSGYVLLVGMPLRHLIEAAGICRHSGSTVLPAGGAGDLGRAPFGTEVLFVASEAGERDVPAATWRAELIGIVSAAPGTFPDALPSGWIEERQATRPAAPAAKRSPFGDSEDDEPQDLEAEQAYFEVRSLSELPTAAWVFVNELVPKQERGGRSYFPRAPRLLERPA